jgi:cytochrome c oxidase subunit 4
MLGIWLTTGCLVFGLIAWLLPIINLGIESKAKNKHWKVLTIASVSACATSLGTLFVIDNHLYKNDWDYDYIPYVTLTLLVVTIVLNIITLAVYRKSSGK